MKVAHNNSALSIILGRSRFDVYGVVIGSVLSGLYHLLWLSPMLASALQNGRVSKLLDACIRLPTLLGFMFLGILLVRTSHLFVGRSDAR